MTSPARPQAVGIASPCTSVCRIDAVSGLCEGCYRSLDEIASWSALGDDAKRAVWKLLPARRQRAAARLPPAAP